MFMKGSTCAASMAEKRTCEVTGMRWQWRDFLSNSSDSQLDYLQHGAEECSRDKIILQVSVVTVPLCLRVVTIVTTD